MTGKARRSKPQGDPAQARRRRCLGPGCGRRFDSTGPGNRLCKNCLKLVTGQAGGLCEPAATGRRAARCGGQA